ncbi:MAG: Smr/MutS family protein [Bacilli bacterium]|nr:Smr/MutS family protein [Bacilli bacterium]
MRKNNAYFEDPFLNILPKLDLHGETGDMVRYLVTDFVEMNRKLGKNKVQIIHGIHGKVIKERTHEVLKNCEGVVSFYLYGWNVGVTIVELLPLEKKN